MKPKVLVVEDEIHLAEGLKLNLSLKGYEVKVSNDGLQALKDWREFEPSLIVLDLMLPELDGFKVIEEIRLYDEKIPILILSARDAIEDKVRCLKKGVDDYLSKPFDLEEFLLRVERTIQRAKWSDSSDVVDSSKLGIVKFGNCWIDFESHMAQGSQEKFKMTIQELKLIKLLYENKNKSLSRNFILENAFGYSLEVNSRTVDNFIVRFRKYFEENPKKPKFFISKRAVGYQFTVKD